LLLIKRLLWSSPGSFVLVAVRSHYCWEFQARVTRITQLSHSREVLISKNTTCDLDRIYARNFNAQAFSPPCKLTVLIVTRQYSNCVPIVMSVREVGNDFMHTSLLAVQWTHLWGTCSHARCTTADADAAHTANTAGANKVNLLEPKSNPFSPRLYLQPSSDVRALAVERCDIPW